jgi:hypothetical protein
MLAPEKRTKSPQGLTPDADGSDIICSHDFIESDVPHLLRVRSLVGMFSH